jgi:hypothetical protein
MTGIRENLQRLSLSVSFSETWRLTSRRERPAPATPGFWQLRHPDCFGVCFWTSLLARMQCIVSPTRKCPDSCNVVECSGSGQRRVCRLACAKDQSVQSYSAVSNSACANRPNAQTDSDYVTSERRRPVAIHRPSFARSRGGSAVWIATSRQASLVTAKHPASPLAVVESRMLPLLWDGIPVFPE